MSNLPPHFSVIKMIEMFPGGTDIKNLAARGLLSLEEMVLPASTFLSKVGGCWSLGGVSKVDKAVPNLGARGGKKKGQRPQATSFGKTSDLLLQFAGFGGGRGGSKAFSFLQRRLGKRSRIGGREKHTGREYLAGRKKPLGREGGFPKSVYKESLLKRKTAVEVLFLGTPKETTVLGSLWTMWGGELSLH